MEERRAFTLLSPSTNDLTRVCLPDGALVEDCRGRWPGVVRPLCVWMRCSEEPLLGSFCRGCCFKKHTPTGLDVCVALGAFGIDVLPWVLLQETSIRSLDVGKICRGRT